MATADDDCSDHSDGECCKAFQRYVEMEQAKSLSVAEKKEGKGTAVRKILKDGLGESSLVSACEASLMSKFQDKKTKKITDDKFVKCLLPELAELKLTKQKKGKKPTPEECKKEERKMRRNLCKSVKGGKEESKGTTKADKVTDRLTDTSKYTGAHKERFDGSGKGKGIAGREDRPDGSGYVANYKGKDTYDKK